MRLDNNFVYRFLGEQGITHLHHANTLATSQSFLNNGGLYSTGLIEKSGLYQTVQDSDKDDKDNDVWEDVFFDTTDLHGLFPRQNLYGPVLFKYHLSLLLEEDLEIFITKNNPIFWKPDTPYEEKYFISIDDLTEKWDKYQSHRKMVTLRKPTASIPFAHLEEIILDNPNVVIYDDTELYTVANEELLNLPDRRLAGMVRTRNCGYCSPDGALVHTGDNLTGEGDGDDEAINVDLSIVSPAVSELCIVVTIHEAEARRQNFGQVRNSFVRIVDKDGVEVLKYELEEDFSIETAVEFGRIYRRNGEWRFEAVGMGMKGGLEEYINRYQ